MQNFEEEIAKATAEFGKEVAEDLVRPTSKSVGDNIGLLVDGVMGWLGYWGEKQKIKREVFLQDYKQKISKEILGIPEANIVEPQIRIVGPAIEASKFFIEEEYCREMFAKLIASACDKTKNNSVHPSFPEVIKQLTPIDARFLSAFKDFRTFPVTELTEKHSDEKVTPYPNLLFDLKTQTINFSQYEQLQLTKTVENLNRCGLVKLNSAVWELDYNYDSFKNHWFYQLIEKTVSEGSELRIKKYRLELTELGEEFLKCCIS